MDFGPDVDVVPFAIRQVNRVGEIRKRCDGIREAVTLIEYPLLDLAGGGFGLLARPAPF